MKWRYSLSVSNSHRLVVKSMLCVMAVSTLIRFTPETTGDQD